MPGGAPARTSIFRKKTRQKGIAELTFSFRQDCPFRLSLFLLLFEQRPRVAQSLLHSLPLRPRISLALIAAALSLL